MTEVYSFEEFEGEMMMMEMAASMDRLADTCHARAETLTSLEEGYRKEAAELRDKAQKMMEQNAECETVQT